jgi:hypothetical protein
VQMGSSDGIVPTTPRSRRMSSSASRGRSVGTSQQHPLLHEDNRQHAMFLQQATGNMQHSGSTDDAALQPWLFGP